MMGQSDVPVRLVLVLVCNDVDDCMTCRPSWWSVPLTVDSILLLDCVLVTFATLVVLGRGGEFNFNFKNGLFGPLNITTAIIKKGPVILISASCDLDSCPFNLTVLLASS